MTNTTAPQDLRQAIEFALHCFHLWNVNSEVEDYYRSWLDRLESEPEPCPHLPEPSTDEQPRDLRQEWRYRAFVDREIEIHSAAGRIALHQAHACQSDNRARGRSLRAKIQQNEVFQAESATEPNQAETSSPKASPFFEKQKQAVIDDQEEDLVEPLKREPEVPAVPRRNILEVILDPGSLQYLMMVGAGMLVVGLVIWLATQGFFDDPLTIAIGMGIGNLAILGGGAALLKWTRFELAGRGLALLACMLMPLHLWFYDAQGLIVLDEGGHLWIPALGILALYTASALLIRDKLFVYAMVGGVTLTGLLILADQNVARFWEGAAASTLLISIGLVAIHVERAFLPGAGPFRREEFGRAFYNAGHLVLGSGLMVLLAWTVCGWTYENLLIDYWRAIGGQTLPFEAPALATDIRLKLLAFALTLVSTYAYVYSYITVQRNGSLLALALFTFLWSELLLADLLPLPISEELIVLMLAGTAALFHAARWYLTGSKREEAKTLGLDSQGIQSLTALLGMLLVVVPVVIGIVCYLRATFEIFPLREVGWLYVGAMVATALACRLGAFVSRNERISASTYFLGAAVATLLAVFGGLWTMEIRTWDVAAPILMIVPITYLLVSRWYQSDAKWSLVLAGHVTTACLLAVILAAAFGIGPDRRVEVEMNSNSHLLLALFFLQTSLFYGVEVWFTRRAAGVYLAIATACGMVWQLLTVVDVLPSTYLLTFGLLGMAMLLAYRLALAERISRPRISLAIFRGGNTLLSLAGVGGILLTLHNTANIGIDLPTLILMGVLMASSLAATFLVAEDSWRRWYFVLLIGQGLAAFLMIGLASDLLIWQKLELFLMVCGIAMLIVAHVGWLRERDQRQDTVSTGLILGSLLVAGPLVVCLIAQRLGLYPVSMTWAVLHDVGLLAAGLALIGSGILCRIRATTITGAVSLVIYLATLLVYIRLPEQLQHVAVYMMIGGGVFFGTALLLSIYRDWILALPSRMRQHQGVFKVLTWR
ncbi:MAG: hypothetical protein WDZ51_20045 [Pirellulaceae bacterium]